MFKYLVEVMLSTTLILTNAFILQFQKENPKFNIFIAYLQVNLLVFQTNDKNVFQMTYEYFK